MEIQRDSMGENQILKKLGDRLKILIISFFCVVILGISLGVTTSQSGTIDSISLQAYAPPNPPDTHPVRLGTEAIVFSDSPVSLDNLIIETDFAIGDVSFTDLRFFGFSLIGEFDRSFGFDVRIDGEYTFDGLDYTFYAEKTYELGWYPFSYPFHTLYTGLSPDHSLPETESGIALIKNLKFTLNAIETDSPPPPLNNPVPEPSTILLFGIGIAGLVGSRIKRK